VSEKILFVDDESNVLSALQRQLRGRYTIETAAGGAAGIAALDTRGPYAAIVSDMRMPDVDGVRVLSHARQKQPDASRILLTGYADVHSAIEAVNRGNIFRFLTKPCPSDVLSIALDAALAQYRLVIAERELLDRTLRGSVKVLGEVLALVNPTAFGQSVRVQQLLKSLGGLVDGADSWEIDVAAVLSKLGCIVIPEHLLLADQRGADLPPDERRMLDSVPTVTRHLLSPIPRLERVLDAIAYIEKPYSDFSSRPSREWTGKDIPLSARLLKVAFDYDTLVTRGVPPAQAFALLRSKQGWYDPDLIAALETKVQRDLAGEAKEVPILELECGMILAENLYSDTGVLLLSSGNPITEPLKRRLASAAHRGQASQRVRIMIPRSSERGA
jgi:response regulator RpfG family c-di-GMP phosphodiesterase